MRNQSVLSDDETDTFELITYSQDKISFVLCLYINSNINKGKTFVSCYKSVLNDKSVLLVFSFFKLRQTLQRKFLYQEHDMNPSKNSESKYSDKISGVSLAVSVISLALVAFLFVRIESVHKKAEEMEAEFGNILQQIGDDLQDKIQKTVQAKLRSYAMMLMGETKEEADTTIGKCVIIM